MTPTPPPVVLTAPQLRVVTFLVHAGHASSARIADHLYGDTRHRGRARLICDRLRDLGVVHPITPGNARPRPGISWVLTDPGRWEHLRDLS